MEEMETGLNKWNRDGGDGNEGTGIRMAEMEKMGMELEEMGMEEMEMKKMEEKGRRSGWIWRRWKWGWMRWKLRRWNLRRWSGDGRDGNKGDEEGMEEMESEFNKWSGDEGGGVGTKEVEWGFFLSPAISKEPK